MLSRRGRPDLKLRSYDEIEGVTMSVSRNVHMLGEPLLSDITLMHVFTLILFSLTLHLCTYLPWFSSLLPYIYARIYLDPLPSYSTLMHIYLDSLLSYPTLMHVFTLILSSVPHFYYNEQLRTIWQAHVLAVVVLYVLYLFELFPSYSNSTIFNWKHNHDDWNWRRSYKIGCRASGHSLCKQTTRIR